MSKNKQEKRDAIEITRIIFLSSTVLIFIFSIIFAPLKKPELEKTNEQQKTRVENGCTTSGCNGEICQEKAKEPTFSVCLYRPEYECYKFAKCERQKNGKCGFTETEEFKDCIKKYKNAK
jgi:eight-cysteine-cluster-containing protein